MGNQETWILALAQIRNPDTEDHQHLLAVVSFDSMS